MATRTMGARSKEYVGSVTLIILGKKLEPAWVSRSLGMKPSKQWLRGDFKTPGEVKLTSKHVYGGWKKFLPVSFSKQPIERQLGYWIKALRTKKRRLKALRMGGNVVYLDLFIATGATATMVWSDEIIRGVANLGIELKLNVWAD